MCITLVISILIKNMTDISQSSITSLVQPLHQFLQQIDPNSEQACHIAVAYSGGVDSSVLLHLLANAVKDTAIVLHAFHIHHGISPHADAWCAHCEDTANQLAIPFHAERVSLSDVADVGIEDSARSARYAALDKLCTTYHIQYLFMAHHQNDQAETLLLHLCRGTGLNGLLGMEEVSLSPLLKKSGVHIVRPWLNIPKTVVVEAAQSLNLNHIEDESNQDIRYTRNTLRHRVIPVLKTYFPHIEQRLLKLSAHAASAQRLLTEMAESDAKTIIQHNALNIEQMRAMNIDRQMNLLQYWLSLQDCRIASSSWLNELYHQLFESKLDAQICVSMGDASIRRFEGYAYYVHNADIKPLPEAPYAFQWQGEDELCFPTFGGKLIFNKTENGIDAAWLKTQSLLLTQRTGGEILKLTEKRPSKSLKIWFQEKHIPAWQRSVLPLVTTNQHQLIFVAGLGANLLNTKQSTESAVSIRWQKL